MSDFTLMRTIIIPVLGVAIMAVSIVALMTFGGVGDAKPVAAGGMEVDEDDDF